MRILVIGSKGFIGSYLTNYLKKEGYEVWGVDVIVDYINIEKYSMIDATNSDFSGIFQQSEFDLCINCSGAASVPESMNNPLKDYLLNTANVIKILESIRKYQNDCRFINLSSAAVYGNPTTLPIMESANLCPLSPYGVHKMQAEQICKEYFDIYNLKTCSLRIFSVYGVGLKKQLFWDLFQKAKSGVPFTLYGTGNESRDYINIVDLVKAIELVAHHSNFEADIINIANGEEVKVKDAVSIFFSFFNEKINYTFSGDIRKGDPVNWQADISKISSYGYKIAIDIKAGLKTYYDWLKFNTHI
jgi:dTDP-glucose 4,6-dehydratase/UDP-glucose 4-epimerase